MTDQNELDTTAAAFIEMAHRIVWATVATVDRQQRPRSRVLHPYWQWDGTALTGIVATGPTPLKRAHLEHSAFVSVNYLAANHDTCTAECRATWMLGDDERIEVWETLKHAPAPVGYDPAMVPPWSGGPTSEAFGALRLEPWRLRVFPGTVLLGTGGNVLTWSA
jgi:hypothetical protein